MEELLPGVFHWTAYRDTIGTDVHSYYVVGARAVVDPMLPDEGLGWLEGERHPDCVVLSQRHHWRDSSAFGLPVAAPRRTARACSGQTARRRPSPSATSPHLGSSRIRYGPRAGPARPPYTCPTPVRC